MDIKIGANVPLSASVIMAMANGVMDLARSYLENQGWIFSEGGIHCHHPTRVIDPITWFNALEIQGCLEVNTSVEGGVNEPSKESH
jgi:hypothetical protein